MAVLGAAPKEELERLLRELESRLGSKAGAKELALRAEGAKIQKFGSGDAPAAPKTSGSPSLKIIIMSSSKTDIKF